MKFGWKVVATIAALGASAFAGAQLDKILKGAGVAVAISQFGPDINKGINKLAGYTNTEQAMTKVVPIITIGRGAYAGAAQVMGPRSLVNKVKAVAQVEGDLFGRVVRFKVLVPVESDNKNMSNIKRVAGVGISAMVDLKL